MKKWYHALILSGLLMLSPHADAGVDCSKNDLEHQCAKCAIYHESRGETLEGQIAVGLVLLNRVSSNKFPGTMCEVVWQKGYVKSIDKWIGQLSFTTDGISDMMHEPKSIQTAIGAFYLAKFIQEYDLLSYFNFNAKTMWYHTDGVSPRWASVFDKMTRIGSHIFYAN